MRHWLCNPTHPVIGTAFALNPARGLEMMGVEAGDVVSVDWTLTGLVPSYVRVLAWDYRHSQFDTVQANVRWRLDPESLYSDISHETRDLRIACVR